MKGLLPKLELFLKRNSSTILTCIGATGVVVTTVLAIKATPKAMAVLEKAEEEKGEPLTKLETVKTASPAYIPTIVSGVSTIACVFGANVLNKRQQATIMSAYCFLDNSYKQYRKKVDELYGEEGRTRIAEALAEERYKEHDKAECTDETTTFMDFYSLQFFDSTWEDVLTAEKLTNDILNARGYVMLSELYDKLGIVCAETEYNLGWTSAMGPIEYEREAITMDNGDECYVLSLMNEPIPLY